MPRESGPITEPGVGAPTEDVRDIKAQGTRERIEQADQEELGASEEREESEDRLRLAWDALNEEQRLEVLRGVIHFEDFQQENKEKIHEIPGGSIDAKTQRHVLQRQTALAFFIRKGDPRIGGLLRDITTLIPRHQAEGGAAGKAERAVLRQIIAKHAQRLLDAESQSKNEGIVPEEEKTPETPEGPEALSKEIWEQLHGIGFNFVEMPPQKGQEKNEDARELVLYVDPTNPNLKGSQLDALFNFDERMAEIQARQKAIDQEIEAITTNDPNGPDKKKGLDRERTKLRLELKEGMEAASWESAPGVVTAFMNKAFRERIDELGPRSAQGKKLAAVQGRGMEYPTQLQGRAILGQIKPRFPDRAIAIYKQIEPNNAHQLMDIAKTGGEISTRGLRDTFRRPVLGTDGSTKVLPVLLEINMTHAEIEKMGLGT